MTLTNENEKIQPVNKIEQQKAEPNPLKRVNSFFAGIGGFELAFSREGAVPAFFCERNDYCRSVLKRHWPDVIRADDIRTVKAEEIPHAEIWTAGFPCQDLSLARTPHGERQGLKGDQSGLFYTFLDLLSGHLPKVVLIENVAGLLNSHKGADFETLLSSLAALGYGVAWRVLNARYFGAPQSRPRVFICAWLHSPEAAKEVLYEHVEATRPKNERRGFVEASYCTHSGISVPKVSFCISATSGRHTGLDWSRTYVTYKDAVRRLTPLECERLQGFPEGWTLPADDYPIPIRGIETARYHAIGNAVCVPVVEWVARRVMKLLTAGDLDSVQSNTAHARLSGLARTGFGKEPQIQNVGSSVPRSWKSGGVRYSDAFFTHPVSSSPVNPHEGVLIDLIETQRVHDRYFLSVNAIQGILRRVDKLGRNLFPPLDATLRKIVADSQRVDDSESANAQAERVAS